MSLETYGVTVEIPREAWRLFCERLSLYRGVSMDVGIHFASSERYLAREVPLHSLIFDDFGDPDLVFVEYGPPNRRPLQHRVVSPERFVLRKETGDDGYGRLEIPAQYGVTVMNFRPAIHPALVEGLVARRLAGLEHSGLLALVN